MIDKLPYGFLNSVYGFNDYTLNELICKIAQKMDEVITQSNESFNYLDWLKGQGLSDEFIKILSEWKEDGTLETLINQNVFNGLNNKIDDVNTELTTIKNNSKKIIHNISTINDYTTIINNAFAEGGIIEFESGEYRITDTVYIDTSKVKKIIGNNAVIVMENEDIYIRELVIEGHLQGSAPPDQTAQLLKEKNVTIEGLRIRNKTWGQGVACTINKTFGLNFINCDFFHNWQGINLIGRNRNINITGCHFYANQNDNISISGNLHQFNVTGCQMSYGKRNIFSNNCAIYNMQISGCDIEMGDFPYNITHEADILFKQTTEICEDIEITGCSFEDHWVSGNLIEFNAETDGLSYACTISGNVLGNCTQRDIYLRNCNTMTITGNTFKKSTGEGIVIGGDTGRYINITGNTFTPDHSMILKVNQNCAIRGVKFDNNVCNVKGKAIEIINPQIYTTSISNNQIFCEDISDNVDYVIKVHAESNTELLNITNNQIRGRSRYTNSIVVNESWNNKGINISNNITLDISNPYVIPSIASDNPNKYIIGNNV